MLRTLSALVVAGVACGSTVRAGEAIRPAVLGETMPSFTLPSLSGGEVSLASLRGKNVVLVFPRVQYGEGQWCTICNYGYAELAELDAAEAVRRSTNAEIVYVVPFAREHAQRWIDATPDELAKVRGWKNPKAGDEKALAFAEKVKRHLPLDLDPAQGARGLPFPILLDADHTLTSGLGLFRTEWGGAKAEQLVPAVFVLDTTGVVRYKHVAQESTWDRPSGREIVDVLRAVARANVASDATRQAIVRTARDYVEGWYEGSTERLRRALHPELAKRKVVKEGEASKLWSLTAADLVANVKPHPLAPGQTIDVHVLDVQGGMATVKIVSPLFVDYAHLALWNGEWKIVNVAWE
jgi:peroxiredoxin